MKLLSAEEEIGLLKKMSLGDEQAFRQLFDTYYKYLTVTAYRYLNDGEKAKDFAQDVFVDLWNRREEIQISFELKAYLRKAVVNKSLNYLKREKRIDFSEPSTLPETPVDAIASKQIEADEMQAIIQSTVDKLPNKCRIVFCMSRFEEKSHKEIAAELGISTKTIENQITRALKSIRQAIAQHSLLCWYLCIFNFFIYY